jgi:hypothetical protein
MEIRLNVFALKVREPYLCHDFQHIDIQHNGIHHSDTQHNDIQHNDIQHSETEHNDTQHSYIQHNKNATLSIVRVYMVCFICSVSFNLSIMYVECHLC